MKSLLRFFRNIRNAEESVRKIWLFVFTIPTMLLVVAFWTMYMHSSLGGGVPEAKAETQEDIGVFSALRAGVGVLGVRMYRGWDRVLGFTAGTVGGTYTITVDVPEPPQNFVVQHLDDIPKTRLP